MPLHRVKSRVRFQGPGKKTKQGDGGKGQCKPTDTIFDGAPRTPLFSNMVDETLFKKKRVPSTDELGDLLRSNLSSSLAAEKAYLEQQRAQCSPPSPVCQYIEQLQKDDDDPPASLLELAPLVYATRDHPETSEQAAVVSEVNHANNGPSASLLTTPAIYAPLNGYSEQVVSAQASSSIPMGNAQLPFNGRIEGAERSQTDPSSAADSCAIEDEDEDNSA